MASTLSEDNMETEEGIREGNILTEFEHLEETLRLIKDIPACVNDINMKERSDDRFTEIVDEYLEQPHLLDPHLDRLLQAILTYIQGRKTINKEMHIAFRYLYLITKVRGHKNMTRKFPHDVKDLEPILVLLSDQDSDAHSPWESRYMLLLWLSMICLIPFDMTLFDDPSNSKEPVATRIINFCKTYLMTSSNNSQEAAALVLAKFLTRPDIHHRNLSPFVDWCINRITTGDPQLMTGITEIKGCLSALALIFKVGKRDDLLEYCAPVLKPLMECEILTVENVVLRKLTVKLTQRVGLTLLKPRIALWRYKRGNRVLSIALKQDSQPTIDKDKDPSESESEFDFEISEDVETVLEVLLTGLKDKDTIVRWSAAKGVGRITGRLPKELADDVVGSVLDNFTIAESDGAWHGGCLALAELGRRSLLLPDRLRNVVPVLLKALMYDERRGAFSVGSHVRDAACYLAWSFARAYEPATLSKYVDQIARALIITAVFDREINCRRAASAAFQENVGRQGYFPHGIEIVTIADYFAVSNRANTYSKVAPSIASFSQYTIALMDHLAQVKFCHWDDSVRWQAAHSMHTLTKQRPNYAAETILDKLVPLCTGMDLTARHGSIIMTAEIVHMLHQIEENGNLGLLSRNPRLRDICRIITILRDAKLFRGVSGEQMRAACSHLIARMSQCTSVITVPRMATESWSDLLHDTLSNLHLFTAAEEICRLAVGALSDMNHISLTSAPFVNAATESAPASVDASVDQYLECLKSENESKRCGYAQAVGSLPKPVLGGRVMKVLRALFEASRVTSPAVAPFAAARRDAVDAMSRVCHTVGVVGADDGPDVGLCGDNVEPVYAALFAALEDYTRDSRGDVGSFVRGAAVKALHDLTCLLVDAGGAGAELLTPALVERLIRSLLQQACEKLHKIRDLAAAKLVSLLMMEELAHVPHHVQLRRIFGRSNILSVHHRAAASPYKIVDLFERLTKVLAFEVYSYDVLLGLVVSVGDLTQSLAEASGRALLAYMAGIRQNNAKVRRVGDDLVRIFEAYSKQSRVSIPLLKTLHHLLVNDCFATLNNEDDVTFPTALLAHVKTEILRSKDANKVLLSVPVFCDLLGFQQVDFRASVLSQLMIMLCHRFPIVRKAVSTQLYELVLTYDDLLRDPDRIDVVLGELSETEWDQPGVEQVRVVRNQLCADFGVAVPKLKQRTPVSSQPSSCS